MLSSMKPKVWHARLGFFFHGGNWEEVLMEKPCSDVFDEVDKPCDVFGEVFGRIVTEPQSKSGY